MFDTLLKTAIIGTANGASVPELDSNEIAIPNTILGEEKLLLAAAFYALQEKGSYQAATYTNELPIACPQEQHPYASLPICELILRCMSKENEDGIVVQEILEKIAPKNWIVLPQVLPQLLAHGQNKPHLHAMIGKVCGERGRWMVHYNKEWKYILAASTPLADWDTGTHEERLGYLRFISKSNAHEAITLLEEDWSKEALKNKKDFIAILAEKPETKYEAFFENILQQELEKDQDIRHKISEFLVLIPHSAAQERIGKHLLDAITLKSGFLSVEKLIINPPTTLAPELKKDGIKLPSIGAENSKQGIFAQILSLYPPSLLSQKLKKTPEELIALAEKNANLHDTILSSLTQAAILHKDTEWLSALVYAKMEKKMTTPEIKKMQNLLPTVEYGKLTEKIAKKTKDKALLFFLANRESVWGETETKIALSEMQLAVRKYANARPWDCNDFKDIAKTVSIYVPADKLKPFSDLLHQMSVNKEWEKELKSYINRIDLRIQISIILN